jgi:hypothetical protein
MWVWYRKEHLKRVRQFISLEVTVSSVQCNAVFPKNSTTKILKVTSENVGYEKANHARASRRH